MGEKGSEDSTFECPESFLFNNIEEVSIV